MTTLLFIVTLVALGVLVAALAVYLLAIIGLLRDIRHTVGLVLFGVRAIAHQTTPISDVVDEINADLTDVRESLLAVVNKAVAEAEGG